MSSVTHQSETTTDIDKALSVSRGIGLRDVGVATQYMNRDNFTQHNLQCADGVAGFEEFMASLSGPANPIEIVRCFQDGPYVFTHAQGDVFGPKVLWDVYRFEGGLIVEHWDNLAEQTMPNLSGHTALDGPTEATDHDATEANKALVRDFFETVFIGGDWDALEGFFNGDELVQHNEQGKDGVAELRNMMRARADAGKVFEVDKIEHVFGEGNFVLLTLSGRMAGTPAAIYELFRVQDGKLAEHWDVLQTIPPRDAWKNCNGKF